VSSNSGRSGTLDCMNRQLLLKLSRYTVYRERFSSASSAIGVIEQLSRTRNHEHVGLVSSTRKSLLNDEIIDLALLQSK
jgi:hypothetical protein